MVWCSWSTPTQRTIAEHGLESPRLGRGGSGGLAPQYSRVSPSHCCRNREWMIDVWQVLCPLWSRRVEGIRGCCVGTTTVKRRIIAIVVDRYWRKFGLGRGFSRLLQSIHLSPGISHRPPRILRGTNQSVLLTHGTRDGCVFCPCHRLVDVAMSEIFFELSSCAVRSGALISIARRLACSQRRRPQRMTGQRRQKLRCSPLG